MMSPSQHNVAKHPQYTTIASLEVMINNLASKNISTRRHALRALIQRGMIAIPSLRGLLKSPQKHIRWEAARALGRIGGDKAAEALVSAIDDESLDVRWAAAEGLILIGNTALVPLLLILIERPDSVRVREAASHVLRAFPDGTHQEIISPVLSALKLGVPVEEVPVAAHEALNKLRILGRAQTSQTR